MGEINVRREGTILFAVKQLLPLHRSVTLSGGRPERIPTLINTLCQNRSRYSHVQFCHLSDHPIKKNSFCNSRWHVEVQRGEEKNDVQYYRLRTSTVFWTVGTPSILLFYGKLHYNPDLHSSSDSGVSDNTLVDKYKTCKKQKGLLNLHDPFTKDQFSTRTFQNRKCLFLNPIKS